MISHRFNQAFLFFFLFGNIVFAIPLLVKSQEANDVREIADSPSELSILERIERVHRRFDIWIGLAMPASKGWDDGLDPKVKQAFTDAMNRREERRRVASRKMSALAMVVRRDEIAATGFPQHLIDKIIQDAPAISSMDAEQRGQLFKEYFDEVLEVETVFADELNQILSPKEQGRMLRGCAAFPGFLAHPVAENYFGLTPSQVNELKRRYDLYDSTNRMWKASLETSVGHGSNGKAIQTIKSKVSRDVIVAKYYEMLGVLTPEQLKDFLVLGGHIDESKSVADWIDSLSDQHKKIAEPLRR